jgi:hypothetical protein
VRPAGSAIEGKKRKELTAARSPLPTSAVH